jgi:hypothetical protein
MAIPVQNSTGWVVPAGLINATTGAAFVGTVTAHVSLDGATETLGTVGAGICTSTGNGCYVYLPSQAETNATMVAVTFTGSNAVPVTVQVPTVEA